MATPDETNGKDTEFSLVGSFRNKFILCSKNFLNFQKLFVDLSDNFSFIEINYHVELFELHSTIRFREESHGKVAIGCRLLMVYNIRDILLNDKLHSVKEMNKVKVVKS